MIVKTCHLYEFLSRVQDKKVICAGAGNHVEDVLHEFQNLDIGSRIALFWDNAQTKWGTYKNIADTDILICQPGEFHDLRKEECVIMISSLYYKEILEQLQKMEVCDHLDCYVLDHMRCQYFDNPQFVQRKDQNISHARSGKMQIPKKIHYCWFGRGELPDSFKRNIETWQNYCGDYEIIRWDENNYDITANRYTLQAYQKKKYGFVPDYIRLDLLYRYGGIYLDTDVELRKNLDDLLFYKGFAGFESMCEVNFGQGVGAIKGLPVIKEMRDVYEKLSFINEDDSLNMTPSPKYQTAVLARHGLQFNDSMQYVADMAVFPQKYFCPKSVKTGLTIVTPETYSIHHFAASWLDETTKLYKNEYKEVLVMDEDSRIAFER